MSDTGPGTSGADAPRLDAVRAELDAVDDKILALLAERLKIADGLPALKSDAVPMRPAREIQMMRRLIAAASEPVEPDLIVELWRVLIAANVRRHGPVDVVVGGGADPVRLHDIARRHYGSRTRIHRATDPRAALSRAAETPNMVAIVPWPGPSGAGGWWPTLSESRYHKVALIAALPFRGDRAADPEAAVFCKNVPLEPAGQDITVALAFDQHHRALKVLAEAGFNAREMARSEPRVLYRIEGFVPADDVRVTSLARGGLDGFRIVGSFARV
ncbi:MAG: chorismate mutase [Caulobacterales bacterium]